MKEACEAFTDWLAKQQTQTMPRVIYVAQDLVNGTFVMETDFPIPDEIGLDDDVYEEDHQWDDILLDELTFTMRARALFKYLGANTVGEAYDKILSKGPTVALRTPNMGRKTLRHMAYVVRKAMSGCVVDGVYYDRAEKKFLDYLNETYNLQPDVDDVDEERDNK
jgi:hypothetical protein